jgi:hypothetical protein
MLHPWSRGRLGLQTENPDQEPANLVKPCSSGNSHNDHLRPVPHEPGSGSSKGPRQRVDQRMQHQSAAATPPLADRSQPLPSAPRARRPSATLPPRATDQKAGVRDPPSARAKTQVTGLTHPVTKGLSRSLADTRTAGQTAQQPGRSSSQADRGVPLPWAALSGDVRSDAFGRRRSRSLGRGEGPSDRLRELDHARHVPRSGFRWTFPQIRTLWSQSVKPSADPTLVRTRHLPLLLSRGKSPPSRPPWPQPRKGSKRCRRCSGPDTSLPTSR